MQFLAYYCATDMLQWEVINGDEKGSDVESISEYSNLASKIRKEYENDQPVGSVVNLDPNFRTSKELLPFKDNFVFLDHSNGDYYWYNTPTIDFSSHNNGINKSSDHKGNSQFSIYLEYEEWVPIGNFGLHNYYFTKESKYASKVSKVQAFKHNKHNIKRQDLPVITSKLTDVKWELITKHLSHYLLKNLPFEFLVSWSNSWDPHAVKPTSVTGSNGKYMELAESSRGSQIATHNNCAVTQFYINKNQSETQTVLNNFVIYYVNRLYNNERVDFGVEESRMLNHNPSIFLHLTFR